MTGLNALYPVIVTAAVSGSSSFAGLIFGIAAYHRIPPPKPRIRKIELVLVGIPFLLLVALIVMFFAIF